MDKFEVGEIAILQNCYNPERNGQEVEIVDKASFRKTIENPQGELMHFTEHRNGANYYASLNQLRKKKPPEELSTWEEIQQLTNWTPEKVAV